MSTSGGRPRLGARFGSGLLGRRSECAALDDLIGAVRAGQSRALVLRGEPGVGKSALLDYLAGQAADCRVARIAGVQSEMELAYAAVHQLCAPMLDRLGRLPAPQRDALGTAFGLRAGPPPDGFLVGLAVLGLLADLAGERPLVCVVDDAQWLDRASAQVLGFVARRLGAESVGCVFALRPGEVDDLSGLPELAVEGLLDADARDLLRSAIPGPLDESVRDRIVGECRGNPLALLELSRAASAGGFGLPPDQALPRRLEDTFRQRLEQLPADTRQLLLLAAAEPLGDAVLVWRAAARLGIGGGAAGPADEAQLCRFAAGVRFRHPLVRSTVYHTASHAERRRAHGALAEATDATTDPDRRAWHRAHAAAEPDEDVAAELERSARRARARGGLAAAAAFLQRSTELTPEPARRAERALAAASALHDAGAPDTALGLLGMALAGPLKELPRAGAALLRADIEFTTNRGNNAPPMLLEAARQLEPLDSVLARDTYLQALNAAMFAGRLANAESGLLDIAAAARAAPAAPSPPRVADLLLDGLSMLLSKGTHAATPVLRRTLDAFHQGGIGEEDELRWMWHVCNVAVAQWDDADWAALADRYVELARAAGALAVLPLALSTRVVAHLFHGDLAEAALLSAEVHTITVATGLRITNYGALALAAWQGREADAEALLHTGPGDATARGEGIGLTVTDWASAVLCNGLGRYDAAREAAARASQDPPAPGVAAQWAPAELVEAATRCGDAELAGSAFAQLLETTKVSSTDWARGIEARARALISQEPEAEGYYLEAIDRLGRSRLRPDLARAHLLYGEWLRRRRRRLEARDQLRAAHQLFVDMDMAAFAERAVRELRATGETARRRDIPIRTDLTPREAQVAGLAIEGLTNSEIGSRLFMSPRTVEYHLHKVFAKLDITSRAELAHVLTRNQLARPYDGTNQPT